MSKMTKIKGLIISAIVLTMTVNFAVKTSAYSAADSIKDAFYAFTSIFAAGKESVLPEGYHDCENIEDAAKYLRKRLGEHDKNIRFNIKLNSQPDFDELTEKLRQMTCEHTGKPTEGDYILYQTGFEYAAEIFLDGDEYLYYFTVKPIYFTTKNQEAKVTAKVKEVINSLKLDGKSNYEKFKLIYDYIIENVSYDEDCDKREGYIAYSAYAALIDGRAVCQGYANLLYRLCLEVGIDCRIVSGTCDGEGHGWNIVRIGDHYYHADPTWDAIQKKYKYFLKCPENISDHVLYDEYNTDGFKKAYCFNTVDCTAENESITISFDTDGGTATIDTIKLKSGDKPSKLPLAAKKNAIFTGWYTSDGKPFSSEQGVNCSVKLIAGWDDSRDNSKLHLKLTDKNGTTISTESKGKTTVIVFGDVETSSKTRKIISDLAQSDLSNRKDIRLIYVDILDNGSKAGYSVPDEFLICPYSEDNAAVCWSYRKVLMPKISRLVLPYTLVIDRKDNIVFAAAGEIGYSKLKEVTFDSVKTAID